MPLFQYFGWAGGFLIAALLAAHWCCCARSAQRRVLTFDQKINIRIHMDHNWPERVVFDTTRSTLAREGTADPEIDVGRSETPVQAVRRVRRDSYSVRPCFRPPCSAGQVADRDANCEGASN